MVESEKIVDLERELMWKRLKLLTDKEREVFLDLCDLLSHKEIAKKHDVTPKRAKDLAYRIYKKLGVSDRTEKGEQNRLVFLKCFCDVTPKKWVG